MSEEKLPSMFNVAVAVQFTEETPLVSFASNVPNNPQLLRAMGDLLISVAQREFLEPAAIIEVFMKAKEVGNGVGESADASVGAEPGSSAGSSDTSDST